MRLVSVSMYSQASAFWRRRLPAPWPDALEVNPAIGLADVLEDGEGGYDAVVTEDEVADAVLRHFGRVLLLAPAADVILEAGGPLDRHDGGDVRCSGRLGSAVSHVRRVAGKRS